MRPKEWPHIITDNIIVHGEPYFAFSLRLLSMLLSLTFVLGLEDQSFMHSVILQKQVETTSQRSVQLTS